MKNLQEIISSFLSLFFPKLCSACHTDLLGNEEFICITCWHNLPETNFSHSPEKNELHDRLLGLCNLQKAIAFFYFNKDSGLQNILHEIKYNNNEALATELGKRVAVCLEKDGFFKGIDIILPIPLSEKKQRKRGYNQSEEFCKGLATVTNLILDSTSVIRTKNTETQTKKNAEERMQNVKNAFAIASKDALKNKHILLVDDVITTGATMQSCANEILTIEGAKVSVLSLAYAII